MEYIRITDEMVRTSLRYLIAALIVHTSVTQAKEEDREAILNAEFNILTNILQPEYALTFVDEITKTSAALKEHDMKATRNEILHAMLNQQSDTL